MRREHELETEFNRYLKVAYRNVELSAIQHQEIKRAFIAGAFTALEQIVKLPDSMTEDQITNKFKEMYEFINLFVKSTR